MGASTYRARVTMRKVGSLVLASVAVFGLFFVFWDADGGSHAVHESTAQPGGAMTGSLYAQEAILFETELEGPEKDSSSADSPNSVSGASVPEGTEIEVEEDSTDEEMTENNNDNNNNNKEWLSEREHIWAQDEHMLQTTDKAMYAELKSTMDEKDSVQWARYMRHKNIHAPAPEGHTWQRNGKEVEGMLLETQGSDSNSLCDHKVKQHHGYFKLKNDPKVTNSKSDKNYFYWLFEARHNPETAPLILWLTGGPGCSSELALFTENGPCKVLKDGKNTKSNPLSWSNKANLVFVDQPAGTGFSYGGSEADVDSNEGQVSTDLYHFMQELVKKYPQYHKSDFYLFGESYAGHFVPATGDRIMQGNKAKEGEYVALKGIGVGNGLTDPEIQYPYYPQMAFHSTTTPKLITTDTYKTMEDGITPCISLIQACNKGDDNKCKEAFTNCNADLINPVQDTGVNVYDAREKCKHPPLCGDYSHVRNYLQSDRVKLALGVTKSWRTCNFGVNGMFHVDWMRSQRHHIPPMLKNGLRVMIYAGDVDFICNWMGNKAWTLKMDWDGKEGYNKAVDHDWELNKVTVGRERKFTSSTGGTFSFVQIHKAGHMVPQDQPGVSLEMVNNFIAGKPMVAPASE